MPTISDQISLTNTQQNKILTKQVSGAAFGAIFACILFSIPLGLMYMFVFHRKTYWFRSIALFFTVYLLGSVVNLLFYRVTVMNDSTAQIDKMGTNDVAFVLSTTFGGFMIVAITLMGLSANPILTSIFENTIGYAVIQFFGLKEVSDDVFRSATMDNLRKTADPNEFNYNFLITRFTVDNLEELIKYGKNCSTTKEDTYKLGLDFRFILDYEEQAEKVSSLVHLKHTIGHFVWIYLASIVALFVSMIAVIM